MSRGERSAAVMLRRVTSNDPVSPRSVFRATASAILVSTLAAACHRSEAARVQIADVDRCERGIERAETQPTLREAMRVYYTECSIVYVEPGCRKAFLAAANAEPSARLPSIADGCKKAYCPLFGERHLELCQAGNQPTAEVVARGWPDLHDAILSYDAKGYAPHLSKLMLRFYVRTEAWQAADPTGPAPAPQNSSQPETQPSASAAPSAPPGASAPR